jgi:ferredoxin
LFYYRQDKEVTSWFAFENETITSTSFFSRVTNDEILQTTEDSTIFQISYEKLQAVFEQYPQAERFARLNQEQIILQLDARLKGLQFQTAKERYAHLLATFPQIMLRVPHHFVASYLGKALNQYPENTVFYLCGPKGFMENIQSELTYLGVNPSNVFTETFVTVAHKPKNEIVGKPISDVTLHFNKTHYLQIMDNETLLDAFIREDINVPYSCQSGICGTCKCALIKGKVAMNNPQALTEKEIAEGFILSCQSVPTTPNIEIKV